MTVSHEKAQEEYRVEDLAIQTRLGCTVKVGIYITKKGDARSKMEYRETYKTAAGKFSPQKWRAEIKSAIMAAGQGDLLEQIKEHCRLHCAWLHKEEEIEDYAMECLASGAYRHWPQFEDGIRKEGEN